MENGEIWSHLNKPLEDHLLGTYKIAQGIAKNCGLVLNNKESIALALHDVAKAHAQFKKKLKTGRGKFGHAEPSSALVFSLTHDLICTEAVRRHHGALLNFPSDVFKFWEEWEWDQTKKNLISQLPWWPGANNINELLELDISAWSDLIPSEDEWEDIITASIYNDESEQSSDGWLRMRTLFSLLVAADRIEAISGQSFPFEKLKFDRGRFEAYLQRLNQTKLAS